MSTRVPATGSLMRKEPRQARSRATVEVIIRAGARVLGDRGWAEFTTNEVASVAGVSIGSLYQYFPDKLALVDAIRHRHLEDVLTVMRGLEQAGKPLGELIDDLVRGMIAAHTIHPALHRVLLDEVPGASGTRSAHRAFEAEYRARYRAVAAACLRPDDPALGVVVQVLSGAVEGVIHKAARNNSLKSPAMKQELVTLIRSYLLQSARL
ncbi:AcrR family transcriptional regulator [Variovorax boronicumulans]|uniref:AcrR family transcriptional regulator n=1 Tax=Variovorax boronicumulans TaxID=436515 RepID=A0AAW8DAD9_9BURK|nr:TetR/AcrR family transcriptional regulator [Variovorax boronicumulans]MDP9896816.1 AcrR family transcriptional regulator [Variovorax boronicumulans]MDQ0056860.1 AcrR family transcriptional regulator [Variovorax boronicumulans]